MRNPRKLKVKSNAARLIDLNECLDALPEAKISDKIGDTDIY